MIVEIQGIILVWFLCNFTSFPFIARVQGNSVLALTVVSVSPSLSFTVPSSLSATLNLEHFRDKQKQRLEHQPFWEACTETIETVIQPVVVL